MNSYHNYIPIDTEYYDGIEQNNLETVKITNKKLKRSKIISYSIVILIFTLIGIFGVFYRTNIFFPSNAISFDQSNYKNRSIRKVDSFKLPIPSYIIPATPEELSLIATNEYGHFDAPYPWMKDIHGTQLIEPYKASTLTLTGTFPDNKDYVYSWIINGEKVDWTGPVFDLTVTDVGKYNIQIHAYDGDYEYISSYSTLLISKYVKREIRSLTNEDREAVLDAMAAVWQYSQEEGNQLFGEKFTSIDTYVTIHSEASNDIMCDQYHEGTGFLTHHLAMAVSFEAAIRSVNPAVTMPYWDFSIEGEAIYQAKQPPSYMLQISDILSKKWFGSVDSDSHIQDGRWAHALMPVAKSEKTTQNSYGYIRSYWNNNPDPEISRHLFDSCGAEPLHKTIPHCSTHYDILNSKDLATLQLLTPGDGHGPMHVQTGGVWGGCTDAYSKFLDKWGSFLSQDMTDEDIIKSGNDLQSFKNKWGPTAQRQQMIEKAIIGEYFHIYRSLWRSHMCAIDNTPMLLECPKVCDYENTPFEECSCSVEKLTRGETNWQNIFPCLLNSDSNRNYFNSTMPPELLRDLVSFVSTSSVLEGEMIESASTADPLFWIIHPVIERLVSAKRIPDVVSMGSKPISKWSSLSKSDWLEYSYYNLQENTNSYYKDSYRCVGHAADDPALPGGYSLPYTDAIQNVADINKDGVVTNWEFLLAIDPLNVDGNDYVFDNFEWNHCS